MAWVVQSFGTHVLYDTAVLGTNESVTGTPGVEYKSFKSPRIDTVMLAGSGPVPATIATDIKGEVTGDKRYEMKITWNAGLANNCVFKIWDVSVRGVKEITQVQTAWFTPSGCRALTERSTTSCVATGLQSDSSYVIKVREVCNTLAASAYAATSHESVRTRPKIADPPIVVNVTGASASTCEALSATEPSGPISGANARTMFCNNENRGGGWTMLMSMGEDSKDFHFDSAHWENETVLNDMNFEADSQKHAEYNTMEFTEFMAVFPDFTLGRNNEWFYKVDTPMTARTFFSKMRVIAGVQLVDLQNAGWATYSGNEVFTRDDWYPDYFSKQDGAKSFGIKMNMPLMDPKWRVRWGYLFNNEYDFRTNERGGGIGRTSHFPSSTGDVGETKAFSGSVFSQYAVQIYGRYPDRPLATDGSAITPKLAVMFTPGELHDCVPAGFKVRARKRNCDGALIGADWKIVGQAAKSATTCRTTEEYSLDHQSAFSVQQLCTNIYANSGWSDPTKSQGYGEINVALKLWGNRHSCEWADNFDTITDSVRAVVGEVFHNVTSMALPASAMVGNIVTGSETIGKKCPPKKEDGFWHLLFRQGDGVVYPLSTWYPHFNKDFPEARQFSRLGDLEDFRMANGTFRFKLRWPELEDRFPDAYNEWMQETNFVKKFVDASELDRQVVKGYQPIHIWSTKYHFAGLEANLAGDLANICPTLDCAESVGCKCPYSIADGSVGIEWWWYPIGARLKYGRGLPGPQALTIQTQELWVWSELPPVTFSGDCQDTPNACDNVKAQGYCTQTAIKTKCPVSCELCTPTTTTTTAMSTTSTKDFDTNIELKFKIIAPSININLAFEPIKEALSGMRSKSDRRLQDIRMLTDVTTNTELSKLIDAKAGMVSYRLSSDTIVVNEDYSVHGRESGEIVVKLKSKPSSDVHVAFDVTPSAQAMACTKEIDVVSSTTCQTMSEFKSTISTTKAPVVATARRRLHSNKHDSSSNHRFLNEKARAAFVYNQNHPNETPQLTESFGDKTPSLSDIVGNRRVYTVVDEDAVTTSRTSFELHNDAGEHVLSPHFTHRRKLSENKQLHLRFDAFGKKFSSRLRLVPSAFSKTATILRPREDSAEGKQEYDEFPVPPLPPTFRSGDNSAVITFLNETHMSGLVEQHGKLVHVSNHDHGEMTVQDHPPLIFGENRDARNRARRHGRSLKVEKWTDCYSRDETTRRFLVGLGLSVEGYKKYGNTDEKAAARMNAMVNSANQIYHNQLNVVITVEKLVNAPTATSGPAWNNPGCRTDPRAQLNLLKDWTPPERLGAWHVQDSCFKGGVAGVAYVGSICRKCGGFGCTNTGVNRDTGHMWKIFAHELGHNFGAAHSFELGQGKTGGIMDYGDGTLNGEYQFNTKFRKTEICTTIDRVVNTCPYFLPYQKECGNGRVEDGETCECTDGSKECLFCKNCMLTAGKECSPESIDSGATECCDANGKLAGTDKICRVDGDKGFCWNGVCTLTRCSKYSLFGEFCGLHDDNQCKIKCRMGSGCSTMSLWQTKSGERLNGMPDGTPCTSQNGVAGACEDGDCVIPEVATTPATTTAGTTGTGTTVSKSADTTKPTTAKPTTTTKPATTEARTFDDCQTYRGRFFEGYAQVHGGSSPGERFTLTQCNEACENIDTCGAFTFAESTGYCELWSTGRDPADLAWGPAFDTYICNRGKKIEITEKCRDNYGGMAFTPEGKEYEGSLGSFPSTTQKQCNDRCEIDPACFSFTTTADGLCTLNPHDKKESNLVPTVNGVTTFFCRVGTYDESKETTKPPKPPTAPPKEDPCACSLDGTVSGIPTGRAGCAQHSGPQIPHYCMVLSNCQTAKPSRAYPGVGWRQCNPDDEQPPPKCPNERYRGDGICDDTLNIEECLFDDGDCCGQDVITKFCKECKCKDPDWSGDQCHSMLKDLRQQTGQVWMRFNECVTTEDTSRHDSWCCSEDGKTKCGEGVGTSDQPRICRTQFVGDQQRTCQTPKADVRSCSSNINRLTFTQANWNVPQKIYVDAIDDNKFEVQRHGFEVKLCAVASGGAADCSGDSNAVVIEGVIRENEAASTTEFENKLDNILTKVCADLCVRI